MVYTKLSSHFRSFLKIFSLVLCFSSWSAYSEIGPNEFILRKMEVSPKVSQLGFRVEGNDVTFVHRVRGESLPFQKEFPGKITLIDQIFYYEVNGTKEAIGARTDEYFEICSGAYDLTCDISFAVKNPSPEDLQGESIYSVSLVLKTTPSDRSFNELEPYVFPSPNQGGSGSCLYMALTGAMEMWLNMKIPASERKLEGDTDLSERFLMNAGRQKFSQLNNFLTDSIYLYNIEKGALRNKDYPYTMGWYKKVDGLNEKAEPEEEGAGYGTSYNWVDEYVPSLKSKLRTVPLMERTILYADPDQNQWQVGDLPDDVIAKIKFELKVRKVPVILVYNHVSYWHGVIIVGYDDEEETGGCPFVDLFMDHLGKKADEYEKTEDSQKLYLARMYRTYNKRIRAEKVKRGGCWNKGVFYVRDSIYDGPEDLMYDYVRTETGEEEPYSAKIVKKSYNWARFLGNHAYSVYPK